MDGAGGDPPEAAEWDRLRYGEALSDLRWAKDQGWRATNWTVALLGGVFFWASRELPGAPACLYTVLVVLIAAPALWWLLTLHDSALATREYLARLDEHYPREVSGPRRSLSDRVDRNGSYLLGAQFVVVLLTAGLVVWGIWASG